jgi:hypothetical protein
MLEGRHNLEHVLVGCHRAADARLRLRAAITWPRCCNRFAQLHPCSHLGSTTTSTRGRRPGSQALTRNPRGCRATMPMRGCAFDRATIAWARCCSRSAQRHPCGNLDSTSTWGHRLGSQAPPPESRVRRIAMSVQACASVPPSHGLAAAEVRPSPPMRQSWQHQHPGTPPWIPSSVEPSRRPECSPREGSQGNKTTPPPPSSMQTLLADVLRWGRGKMEKTGATLVGLSSGKYRMPCCALM